MLAIVATPCYHTIAWFLTLELDVISIGGVTHARARVATLEPLLARQLTTSVGTLIKLAGFGYVEIVLGMVVASEPE